MNIFGLNLFQNPAQNGNSQAQYIRQMVENSGSEQLKKMVREGRMSDDQLVQYVMAHPEELQGAQGQGQAGAMFAMAGIMPNSAAAPSSESSSTSSASDSFDSSSDDEGDSDLKPFSQDETMASPSMCAMGGASAADKAKPEMQQNLREVKAISKAMEEMASSDTESSSGMNSALSQLREQEQIIRSCLKRGKGAADDAYKAHGIDPKDMSSVSGFVADIGKKVIDVGQKSGLEIEVSQKRAERLQAGGGQVQQDKGAADGKGVAGGKEANKGIKAGGDDGGDEGEFQIQTQKTEKTVQMGADEVEANPVMRDAILEQLTNLYNQKQVQGDAFQAPAAIDLGETKAGSPLDQAFAAAPAPQAGGGEAPQGGEAPRGGGEVQGAGGVERDQAPAAAPAAPAPAPAFAQAPAQAPAQGQQGKPEAGQVGGVQAPKPQAGAAPSSIAGLMAALGMAGQKFNAKVQVYEPGQMIQMNKTGDGGGVKVNGDLQGKAIKVKIPKMVARDQDGKLHAIGGLQKVGNSGFMAKIKGDAAGAGQAAKEIQTTGDGSISIPGAKAT